MNLAVRLPHCGARQGAPPDARRQHRCPAMPAAIGFSGSSRLTLSAKSALIPAGSIIILGSAVTLPGADPRSQKFKLIAQKIRAVPGSSNSSRERKLQ
jgi:hypothetical protein